MKKNRQVLQLCHGYTPPFLDVARQYASLFEQTPYLVTTVFLTGKKDPTVITQAASDTVLFLEYSSSDLRGLKRKQIKQIKQLHQEQEFEFAIAHRYKAIYICCHIKKLKVIGILHAFAVFQRWSRRLFVYFNKRRLYLLGVSDAVRDELRQTLSYFPREQIQTLYNHIDYQSLQSKQLSRNAARDLMQLQPGNFYFVNIGRLHPDKDQKTLIKAFAEITGRFENTRLMIFGTGRLEKTLWSQVERLGLTNKVRITSQPDIAFYLKAFDCFVLSSDHEPFGMVLLEAMAAGLPVISTREAGAGEVVGDCGWLVNQGDHHQLSERMQEVYMLLSKFDDVNAVQEIITLKKNMARRIKSYFDDQAAKKIFWNLPFVKHISNTKTQSEN